MAKTGIRMRGAASPSINQDESKNETSNLLRPDNINATINKLDRKENGNGNANNTSAQANKGDQNDDISFFDLLPAVAVATLVSVSSYWTCGSVELAEDVVIATIRTFLQLSILAAFLSPLFHFVEKQSTEVSSPSTTLPSRRKGFDKLIDAIRKFISYYSAPLLVVSYVFFFMLPLAAYEASSRAKLTLVPDTPATRYPVVFLIVTFSLLAAVSTMGFVAIFVIVKPCPRYSPRHVIPFCGMLFNNALSSISLALDVLFSELRSNQRETIELMISFGADIWSATRPSFRTVLASSLRPQINSMNVIGLVAIPGMMTGQVLAGSSPLRASRYQIVIMCLILGAGFVSVAMTVELVIWNVFDERGVLKEDRIVENKSLRVSQLLSSNLFSESKPDDMVIGTSVDSNIAGNLLEAPSSMVKLHPEGHTATTEFNDISPLLQVNLNGTFADGNKIMNANFVIPTSNDVIILQGPSGVGKTTLLRTIAELNSGFVPISSLSPLNEPSLQISLSGKSRTSFHPSQWRQSVLYLPQKGTLTHQGTPNSFLQFISSSRNKNQSQQNLLELLVHATSAFLHSWGIQSPQTILSQPWPKLSGGESQRVLLAIALATQPKVLLLDEPTSALDDETKAKVEKTLKIEVAKGCAMVMATHDEEQAKRMGTFRWRLDEVQWS